MSFLIFLLCPPLPTSAALTQEAGVVESLGSLKSFLPRQFFFLSFLALSKGSDSWVEADVGVDAEPLEALESSPQFTAPCAWTLWAVVWAGQFPRRQLRSVSHM